MPTFAFFPAFKTLQTDNSQQFTAAPVNAEAARLYTENRPEHIRRVKQCVERFTRSRIKWNWDFCFHGIERQTVAF
jgi:pantothenate synthetase